MSSITGWIDWSTHALFETFGFPEIIDRRDLSDVPLGIPQVLEAPQIPGDELSDLVIAEVERGTTLVPASIDPLVIATDWFDYWERMALGENVLPPNTIQDPGILKDVEAAAPIIEEVDVPFHEDFFADLGDLGIDLARRRVGMDAPPAMGFTMGTGGGGPSLSIVEDPLMPPLPLSRGACDTGPSPVYKKVCGVYKWVYSKHRRRRQLLTESDYNGLLRIESLKVNKNMTVAIAKALTR